MSGTDSLAALTSGLMTPGVGALATRSAAGASSALPAAAGAPAALVLKVRDHLAALIQLVDASHHHRISRIEPGGDFGHVALFGADGNVADGDGAVGRRQQEVAGRGSALHGRGGNQDPPLLNLHSSRELIIWFGNS